jgi:serine/threonine protein kinase
MDDRIGQQFGNYRILRLLGEGGFARVYLGKHLHLRSLAAIKVLHTKLVTRERDAFIRETRTIAELDHPSIIRVLDSGFDQESPYVVMNYAPGGTLRQRHPKGSRLPLQQIITYIVQIAAALQYAHEHQIIHRDVKPENMLLGRNDRVLLGDFGIALISSASITQGSQMVAGSVAYMAPEQIMGKPQPASDQYALGVVVYEWFTGEQLFQGTFSEQCAQHLYAPPPPLQEKNPTVSSAVEDIIVRALAKDPARRFASIQEFADALAQHALGEVLEIPWLPDISATEQTIDEDDALLRDASLVDSAPLPVQYPSQNGSSGEDAAIISGDTPSSNPSVPTPAVLPVAQTAQEDLALRAESGKRAIALALKSADTIEQEQTRPLIPHEEAVSTQPLLLQREEESTIQPPLARVAVDTPALSFPALAAGWHKKLSDIPLWSGISRPGKRKAVIAASLLALLLVSSVAYAVPHISGRFGQVATPTPVAPPLTAAVTITPQQKEWSKSYALSAVMGTPHATQHQVQAHWLSITTAPQAQTVKATGVKVVPGTGVPATGTLTIDNTATVPLTFNQGTVLNNTVPNTGAQQMMVVTSVTVPAASPAQPHVQMSVSAHVVQVGATGNIAAGQFIATGTAGASPMPNWSVTNPTPFMGGVDRQTSPFVQQSDIDSATRTLIQANAPDPLQVLKPQLAATDRLVGQGWCTPNKSADHQANEPVATVTVSVSFTCVGDVYNRDRAALLATDLFREDMKAAHYVFVGSPKIMVTQQAIADDQGTITLQLQAQVTGIYSFDDVTLQTLARQIAGKSVSQAQSWLVQHEGVGKATITLAGGTSRKSLPTRVQDITVSIAA